MFRSLNKCPNCNSNALYKYQNGYKSGRVYCGICKIRIKPEELNIKTYKENLDVI